MLEGILGFHCIGTPRVGSVDGSVLPGSMFGCVLGSPYQLPVVLPQSTDQVGRTAYVEEALKRLTVFTTPSVF